MNMTTQTYLADGSGAGSGSGSGAAARPGGAGTGDSGSAFSAFFSESSKTSSRPPDSRDAKTSSNCGSAPTAGPGRKLRAAVLDC